MDDTGQTGQSEVFNGIINHIHNGADSSRINPRNLLGFQTFSVADATVAPTDTAENGVIRFLYDSTKWVFWVRLNNLWKSVSLGVSSTPTGFTSKARAYLGTNQAIASASEDIVKLDTENYDIDSEFNTGTYKFTATATGYYLAIGSVSWISTEVDKQYTIRIYKNNSSYVTASQESSYATTMVVKVSDIIPLTAGDTLSLYAIHTGAGSINMGNGSTVTFLAIHRLS